MTLCAYCGLPKRADEFTGRHRRCKDCRAFLARRAYSRDPAPQRAYARSWYARNRERARPAVAVAVAVAVAERSRRLRDGGVRMSDPGAQRAGGCDDREP